VIAFTKIWRRQNQPPIAIFLHDGGKWHATAFAFKAGDCLCMANNIMAGADYKSLPPDALSWAADNRCARVRIFVPADVHEVELHLPADASPAEAQTALAYELAAALKVAPTSIRVAAVRADVYRMGANPDLFLAAAFDIRLIECYESVCRAAGLKFEGVGALEMAALARHARVASERGFLLVRPRAIFAAVPAMDGERFFVRHIPFGLPSSEDDLKIWGARLAARLARFKRLPTQIVTSQASSSEAAAAVREALGCAVTEAAQMDETAALIMRHAAWANVGVIDNGCAAVSKPRATRDWRRLSSWTTAILPLCALLFCSTWEMKLKREADERGARAAAAQKAREDLARLQQEMAREKTLAAIISAQPRVEAVVWAVLSALPEGVGRRSQIRSFRQENGALAVEGETRSPAELPRLRRALSQAAAPFGWQVEENALRTGAAADRWIFSYRLSRGGR